jgi:hypothetical protein
LRRKQLKIRQVQKEIKALNIAIVLLADDENELSRSSSRHPEPGTRPWPIRASIPGDIFGQQASSPALAWNLLDLAKKDAREIDCQDLLQLFGR